LPKNSFGDFVFTLLYLAGAFPPICTLNLVIGLKKCNESLHTRKEDNDLLLEITTSPPEISVNVR
jgi:hypothetical protein